MIFKGGTSLSKGFGIIERFSEDIDLAISHSFFGIEKTGKSQREKLRKMSRAYIHKTLSAQLDARLKEMGVSGYSIENVKEGTRKAKPCILEPMMKVEIEIPEENTGDIVGDIASRRGRIEGMEIIEGTGIQKVRAIVPLAEMFGYATDIRSKTQGRGTFSMEFSKYEQVPANVEKEIIEKSGVQA